MAAVIQFAQKDRGATTSTLQLGPAQIIIFPGVRFERLDLAPHPEDDKPGGSGPLQHHAVR